MPLVRYRLSDSEAIVQGAIMEALINNQLVLTQFLLLIGIKRRLGDSEIVTIEANKRDPNIPWVPDITITLGARKVFIELKIESRLTSEQRKSSDTVDRIIIPSWRYDEFIATGDGHDNVFDRKKIITLETLAFIPAVESFLASYTRNWSSIHCSEISLGLSAMSSDAYGKLRGSEKAAADVLRCFLMQLHKEVEAVTPGSWIWPDRWASIRQINGGTYYGWYGSSPKGKVRAWVGAQQERDSPALALYDEDDHLLVKTDGRESKLSACDFARLIGAQLWQLGRRGYSSRP